MSLARDIAELEARLRERTDVNPFAPLASSGLPSTPDFNALLSRIAGQRDSAAMLRLCLQALRVQHQQLQPRLIDAELVATLPGDTPGIARPTESAISEMVGGATNEVIPPVA